MTGERRFYSPEQFGDLMEIHQNTIRELCRRGEIPSLRVGKQYRIPSTFLTTTTPPIPVGDADAEK